MFVYVAQMYRWGDPQWHSYIAGIAESESDAAKMGALEVVRKNGRYRYAVHKFDLNKYDPKGSHKLSGKIVGGSAGEKISVVETGSFVIGD